MGEGEHGTRIENISGGDDTPELVRAAREGRQSAFDPLVDRYYGTAYAIALAHLRVPEEAEDLTQEAFLRAYVRLEELNDDARFGPWIGRITRNLAIDWQRRGHVRRRLVPLVPMDELFQEPPDTTRHSVREQMETSETSRILMEHINALPVHLREVVLLHYMEGVTQTDIAEMMGVRQGAIASRLHTALKRLRGALEPLLREGLQLPRPAARQVRRIAGILLACSLMSAATKASIAAQVAAETAASGSVLAAGGHTLLATARGLRPAWKVAGLGGAAMFAVGIWSLVLSPWTQKPFHVVRHNRITAADAQTSNSVNGWSSYSMDDPALAWNDFNHVEGALRAHVAPATAAVRQCGWKTNRDEHVPYAAVGAGNIVRAKFYIYRGGQQDMADPHQVPGMRFRLSTRYAVTAMLNVAAQPITDPHAVKAAAELLPSTDPRNPSLYRIDFDPVDVPQLQANPTREGIMRGFEAYASWASQSGYIGMVESVAGVYPALLAVDDSAPAAITLAPAADSAGSLALADPARELEFCTVMRAGTDWTRVPRAMHNSDTKYFRQGPEGFTLDTAAAPGKSRVAVVRNFLLPHKDAPSLHAEEDRLYSIRWHLRSSGQAARNAQIRLCANSVAGIWQQALVIGGSGSGAGEASRAIAAQSLPGVGCMNPDANGAENGGWYTVIAHSPLCRDLRPAPAGTPLARRQPLLAAEPGTEDRSASLRRMTLACELWDSTCEAGPEWEQGNVTIDRIEVRVVDQVPD